MFGISFTELLVVFSLVLIIFGPEKLPEIASTLGKAFSTFRKSTDSLRREFYNSVYTPAEEFKRSLTDSARELTALTPEEEARLSAPDPDCPDNNTVEEQDASSPTTNIPDDQKEVN